MGGEGPVGNGGWWVLEVISGFSAEDVARSKCNGVKWVGSLTYMKSI